VLRSIAVGDTKNLSRVASVPEAYVERRPVTGSKRQASTAVSVVSINSKRTGCVTDCVFAPAPEAKDGCS